MASHRQIAANRRNAKRSTGPRSAVGKARSRRNALTHGLTAQHLVLPDEDPEEFDALREAIFASLAPEDALQDQLVERAASLAWRLRRVPVFEVALFAWMKHVQAKMCDGFEGRLELRARKLRLDPAEETIGHNSATPNALEVGRTFEALLNTDLTSKLSRYETSLQRQFQLTLKELRELQANRSDRSKKGNGAG